MPYIIHYIRQGKNFRAAVQAIEKAVSHALISDKTYTTVGIHTLSCTVHWEEG